MKTELSGGWNESPKRKIIQICSNVTDRNVKFLVALDNYGDIWEGRPVGDGTEMRWVKLILPEGFGG